VKRPQHQFYRDFATSDHSHPYTDDSGFADFMDADDALAELLRRGERARANRRGQDLQPLKAGEGEVIADLDFAQIDARTRLKDARGQLQSPRAAPPADRSDARLARP
jgi:hypothetical protein